MDKDELNRFFYIIFKRIESKKKSLEPMKNFRHTGIEAWFKVEIIKALTDEGYKNLKLQNRGPDLIVNNIKIELKGMTDFNNHVVYKDANKGGADFCLFLVKYDKNKLDWLLLKNDIKKIDTALVDNYWLIGIIKKN